MVDANVPRDSFHCGDDVGYHVLSPQDRLLKPFTLNIGAKALVRWNTTVAISFSGTLPAQILRRSLVPFFCPSQKLHSCMREAAIEGSGRLSSKRSNANAFARCVQRHRRTNLTRVVREQRCECVLSYAATRS